MKNRLTVSWINIEQKWMSSKKFFVKILIKNKLKYIRLCKKNCHFKNSLKLTSLE